MGSNQLFAIFGLGPQMDAQESSKWAIRPLDYTIQKMDIC